MDYEKWEHSVPGEIRDDSLWKVKVYRLGMFIGDVGWQDVSRLYNDRRTRDLSNQLYHALGSISTNIAEGYSRSSGRDKARFYEYALGSARESRDWYFKSRDVIGEDIVAHRINILTQIIRLLIKMIPQQRNRSIAEDYAHYDDDVTQEQIPDLEDFNELV